MSNPEFALYTLVNAIAVIGAKFANDPSMRVTIESNETLNTYPTVHISRSIIGDEPERVYFDFKIEPDGIVLLCIVFWRDCWGGGPVVLQSEDLTDVTEYCFTESTLTPENLAEYMVSQSSLCFDCTNKHEGICKVCIGVCNPAEFFEKSVSLNHI